MNQRSILAATALLAAIGCSSTSSGGQMNPVATATGGTPAAPSGTSGMSATSATAPKAGSTATTPAANGGAGAVAATGGAGHSSATAGTSATAMAGTTGGANSAGSSAGGAAGVGSTAVGGSSAGAGGGATAGAGGGNSGGAETFAAIYKDIFANSTNSCTSPSCHGRKMMLDGVGNLDLSTADAAYMALVGRTSDSMMCKGKVRVKAGDAMNSLLVTKLRDATVDCGALMPLGADAIDDASLMRIVRWVNAGAKNN